MTSSAATTHASPSSQKPPIGQIAAWASWEWGTAALGAVMTTFVFTTFYLTSDIFGGETHASAVLGWTIGLAGVIIALLAPVLGQRSDRSGRRKLWLGINTAAVVVLVASCFFVLPEPQYLLLGAVLLAGSHVFLELAMVSYNAMLLQISTPKNIGKISGLGWGASYLGGIVLLLALYFGFLSEGAFPELDETLKYRIVALICAAWITVFSIPILVVIPENKRLDAQEEPRGIRGMLASYQELFNTVRRLWQQRRSVVLFLLASAIFRDGIAGITTFGAIIARGTFGFETSDILIFAIASNVIAAAGAFSAGFLEDKIGPKRVIIIALIGLLICGVVLFFGSGKTIFWIFGLGLTLFIGPAQASSRSLLGQYAEHGREGELYGLYATTGRAAAFIAPLLLAAFISIFGAQRWGMLAIMLVVLAGLLLMIPVKPPQFI